MSFLLIIAFNYFDSFSSLFFFLIFLVVNSHENKISYDLNTHKGNASNFTRQIIQQSSNSFFKHSKTHQNNKNIFPKIFNVEYCYEIWETGFIIVENIPDIIQENLYRNKIYDEIISMRWHVYFSYQISILKK